MDAQKEEITNRLRRIEGQIRGLQRMIAEDRDCGDLITQFMAARAALDQVGLSVITRYIEECGQSALENEEGKEKLTRAIRLWLKFS
ncbi:MAG: metal-sensitive transcriptional regulator [Chloroflexi bacterium]|nr:metal-sensitive transcriptional regulator [Chloroflexota bacterium]